MKQDEIIEMAKEAGCMFPMENEFWGYTCEFSSFAELEDFAKLVDAKATAKEREHYDDLFANIKNWCEAYPISVFPEPDFKKAHEVLKANGMTLDAISASNMKHVITQVQKMIDEAIRARSISRGEA